MTRRTPSSPRETGRTPGQNRLLAAALQYAGRGWSVLPLHTPSGGHCSCNKATCGSPGKHPRTANGVKDATLDEGVIREWWRRWPNANIGIALGPSGLFVLDLDGDEGRASLNGRVVPQTPCVRTAKGFHYYFRHDHQGTPLVGCARFLPGLDSRSAGSFVVAPPSHHASGHVYAWADGLRPEDVALGEVPTWIARALGRRREGGRFDTAAAMAGIPEGGRDTDLFRLACKLRRADVPLDSAVKIVEDAAERCRPPFPADAAREKVERAYATYPPGGAPAETQAAPWAWDPIPSAAQWPAPLAPAAFHGLASDFVRLVEPHSEADPAALLGEFLVAFGNVIGRGPHFVAEEDQHYTNLYLVLVGKTAKARKGVSWSRVRRPLREVDEEWVRGRCESGLSSGEGLIWAVRDAIEKDEPVKERGRVVDYQTVVEDQGVKDKRLLVTEAEFASTLRVMGRDGNTLSALVRMAWDTGNLHALTKNSPARASGAHISIIGHVTRDELLRYLDRTEQGNGFANRFLWVCAERSKSLPECGRMQDVDFEPFVRRLTQAVEFAAGVGEMTRDNEARALWHEVYPELSEGKPGLLGAVIARAEAQVMRLACIYALLDRSRVIRHEHLEAALAVWRYCEDSARFIFGEALGDPLADEIGRFLRQSPDGATLTDIHNHFRRHKNAGQMGRALSQLAEHGLARHERRTTGGRPEERWYSIRPQASQRTTRREESEVSEGTAERNRDSSLSSLDSQSGDCEDHAPDATCCECGNPNVYGCNRRDGRTYCLAHWRGDDADRIPPGARERQP